MTLLLPPPSAQAVVRNKRNTHNFSACTDPIGSGIVNSLDAPGGNVTGTSDAVSKNYGAGLQLTPEIKTVGALYNAGETTLLPSML